MYFSESTEEEKYWRGWKQDELTTEVVELLDPLRKPETDRTAELLVGLRGGSAIARPETVIFEAALKIATRAAVMPAFGALVATVWHAVRYPMLAPIVKLAPGVFGPPGWMAAAVATVASGTIGSVPGGWKAKRDRKRHCETLRVAVPAVYGVALADGVLRIEELRFIRDLIDKLPPEKVMEGRQLARDLINLDNTTAVLSALRLRQGNLNSIDWETVLRYAILVAYSDGTYQENEKSFIEELVTLSDLEEEEFQELASEVETEYSRKVSTGEAMIRAMFRIARADGFNEEARALLDVMLMSTVPPEGKRRELRDRLLQEYGTDGDPCVPKVKIIHQSDEKPKTFFKKCLNLDFQERGEEEIRSLLESCAMFVVALDQSAEVSSPTRRHELINIGKRYGVEKETVMEMLEDAEEKHRKVLEKSQEVEEATGDSMCPTCGTVGKFTEEERQFIGRNAYKCRNCGQVSRICGWPGCSVLAPTGDIYDPKLCDQHRLFGGDSNGDFERKNMEGGTRENTATAPGEAPEDESTELNEVFQVEKVRAGTFRFRNGDRGLIWRADLDTLDAFAVQRLSVDELRIRCSDEVYNEVRAAWEEFPPQIEVQRY